MLKMAGWFNPIFLNSSEEFGFVDRTLLLLLPRVDSADSFGKDNLPLPVPTSLTPPTTENVSFVETNTPSLPDKNND
jgi:hypothetical protein